mmetsp:Transcript_63720/g.151942  ORF Transcript_63720/g.151942 Transcript_63720/m.151942 type:complete len:227 (+) Transcript_63720:213-893(+)
MVSGGRARDHAGAPVDGEHRQGLARDGRPPLRARLLQSRHGGPPSHQGERRVRRHQGPHRQGPLRERQPGCGDPAVHERAAARGGQRRRPPRVCAGVRRQGAGRGGAQDPPSHPRPRVLLKGGAGRDQQDCPSARGPRDPLLGARGGCQVGRGPRLHGDPDQGLWRDGGVVRAVLQSHGSVSRNDYVRAEPGAHARGPRQVRGGSGRGARVHEKLSRHGCRDALHQ